MKPHPMLSNRDMRRFNFYNKILTMCKEPHNATALSRKLAGTNGVTIANYCKELELEGYLTTSIQKAGTYNTPSTFYKTRIKVYKIENLIPISVKINATMKVNGSSTQGGGIQKEVNHYTNKDTQEGNIKTYRMESRANLYLEQSKQARREYKHGKNYVKGSSLGMF